MTWNSAPSFQVSRSDVFKEVTLEVVLGESNLVWLRESTKNIEIIEDAASSSWYPGTALRRRRGDLLCNVFTPTSAVEWKCVDSGWAANQCVKNVVTPDTKLIASLTRFHRVECKSAATSSQPWGNRWCSPATLQSAGWCAVTWSLVGWGGAF